MTTDAPLPAETRGRTGQPLGPNPFVGPRPFQSGERLFGRLKETRELYYLLSAERIVWLHSPSGAGKTSLIWAALAPRMVRDGFHVCPPIRVNLALPRLNEGADAPAASTGGNRFLASLLLSLEEGLPKDQRLPVEQICGMSLGDYLAGRLNQVRDAGAVGTLMVFDQFEEILTTDPLEVEQKRAFFRTLGEALRDPGLWALFALREEFLAQMEPYVDAIPTRWSNTFRLELLGREAVHEVLTRTAELGGRSFDPTAAASLFDDLARTKVQRPDGSFAEETGRYVEPVQLQVVCRRLWDAMPADDPSIDPEDLTRFGNVGEALAGYYSDAVARIAAGDLGLERRIREWFGTRLITPAGIRGQVVRGATDSDGCENAVVGRLLDTHLVRGEKRAGATWYELAHDRLIAPIRESNQTWYEDHLEPFQRQTALWIKSGRPASGGNELLRGIMLSDALRFAADNPGLVSADEQKLIAISRNAREIRRWTRGTAIALVILSIAFAYYAWGLKNEAQKQEREAWFQVAIGHWKDADSERQGGAPLEAAHHYTLAAARFAWARYDRHRENALLARRFLLDERMLEAAVEHPGGLAGAAWSPDGTALLTWGGERARLWDAYTGEARLPPLHHRGPIHGAAFNPEGSRLLTWSPDGSYRVWDPRTGYDLTSEDDRGPGTSAPGPQPQPAGAPSDRSQPHADPGGISEVRGALPSQDRKRFLTWGFDGSALVWQRGRSTPVALPLAQRSTGLGARMSDDGRCILVWTREGMLWVLDLETGMPRSRPVVHPEIQGALFRPNALRVLTWGLDGSARLWDTATGAQVGASMHHDDAIIGARLSPDHTQVVTWSEDGSARLWDARTGGALMLPMRHQGTVLGADFAPPRDAGEDSTAAPREPARPRLLTWGEDGSARVWRAPERPPETPRPEPAGEPQADSAADASGSEAQQQTTVNLEPADLPPPLRRIKDLVGASLDAAGNRILTWGGRRDEGSAQLWNAITGEALTPPLRHDRRVTGAQLAADGHRVITRSDDGTARVWDTRSGDPLTPPLALGRPVTVAVLDASGRRLRLDARFGESVTFDLGGDDDWPFDELVLRTEVETGTRLLPNGQTRALTPVEWQRLRFCDYDAVRHELGRLDDDAWAESQRRCAGLPRNGGPTGPGG